MERYDSAKSLGRAFWESAALLVIGFFIDMPHSELRFGVATGSALQTQDGSAEPPLHGQIMNGAYAKVAEAKHLYTQLSFAEEFPLPREHHPPKARFGPSAERFLEEFTIERDAGGAKVRADGLVIYRWLYDLLGIRDYCLIATVFEPATCEQDDCWHLTINYTFGDHADFVDNVSRSLREGGSCSSSVATAYERR